jgi:serine/threonine protein kinase
MSTTVFQRVGPYAIVKRIGGGGMGLVFLATDTRSNTSVALKVVPDEPDDEALEILAAERRGAELQLKFSQVSQYVPRVYEVGIDSGHFYIAMEYIEGEDLSSIIRRGPIAPERAAAIAIQLCTFLEEVDRVQTAAGTSSLTLLHNDLKPTNVRLAAGDRVKVLDFGAAKELSLSRRVTRHVFGSSAYLSPECIESGERDRQTDVWALGVILYEMAAGRAPFLADNTRRLEERIRSRRPPEPLTGISPSLQAVIAKLLAPYPKDRYESANAIRTDLERFLARVPTIAESEGWPGRSGDEPQTRRTRQPVQTEPPTRRTIDVAGSEAPTRATPRPVAPTQTGVITERLPGDAAVSAPPAKRSRVGRFFRGALLFIIVATVLNESCVAQRAQRLAATVPMQEFAGLTSVWTSYDELVDQSSFGGVGVRDLEQALKRQTLILAERVLGNYRTPKPTVREAQWQAAANALRRALTVAPTDTALRAALRCAEGHLHRINGEAQRSRGEAAKAQQQFAEAVSAFREAAVLRPTWPDPFLGLARTFIYGIEDIDRGADAMNQAQKLGHPIGSNETAQLADGYRIRGETLERAARELIGMPQEREFLTRAAAAYRQALELYSKIANFADVPAHIRGVQNRLNIVERRLEGVPWE